MVLQLLLLLLLPLPLVLREPAPQHLPLPDDHVPVPGDPLQLQPHLVVVADQLLVVDLEVPADQHPLGAAVLRVAAVLERAPLLLELDDLLPGVAVQSLVQLTDTQVHKLNRELSRYMNSEQWTYAPE